MQLDFDTGVISPSVHRTTRTYGDLRELFEAIDPDMPLDTVIYETYGCAGDAPAEQLLYGTTVLKAGKVCREPFMTRGHVHLRPDRGELCLTLRGSGLLLLVDDSGKCRQERMEPGSIHSISGHEGHRVVNTGSEDLVFFVSWMSDCGHDYDRIAFPRVS